MSNHQTRPKQRPANELASFISSLSFEDLPANTVATTERIFVDEVGVLIAGLADEATASVKQLVCENSTADKALLDGDARISDIETAFVLGTAGHSFDYNNTTMGAIHPSVAPMAGILAVAGTANATGEDLVTAYIAGYETQCYLGAAILPSHYERGWHPTSTLGVFGVTAAAANLLELNRTETAHALNLTASMASGLVANFGTMTKPLHAGHAARSGLTATQLANDGFTASKTALGDEGGFLDLYSGDQSVKDRAFPALGDEWGLLEYGIEMKKYPCCSFTHSGISATNRLRAEYDLTPDDIEKVDVVASEGAADCLQYPTPATAVEARFSMPYTIAYVLENGDVDLEAFEEDQVSDPILQALQERVQFSVDPDLSYNSHKTSVSIHTTDGEQLEATQTVPPGANENPLSTDELRQKFEECLEYAPIEADDEALYSNLKAVSECSSLNALLEPIRQ